MPNIRRDDAEGHEKPALRRRRAPVQRRDDEGSSDPRIRSVRQRDFNPHFVNPGLALSGGRTGLTGGALSVQVVPDIDGDSDSNNDGGRKRLGVDGDQSDPDGQSGRFITLNIGGPSRATSAAVAGLPAAPVTAVAQQAAAATSVSGNVAGSLAKATATASAIALAPEQDPEDLPPTTGNSTLSTPNNATVTSTSATQAPSESSTVPALPPPTTATTQPSTAAQSNGYLYLGKPDSKSMNVMGIAIGATSGIIILAIVAYLLIRRERRGQRRLPYLRPRFGNTPAGAARPNAGLAATAAAAPPSRPSSLWGGSDAGGGSKPMAAGQPINMVGGKTNSAIMDEMMRAAFAAENGGNVLADAAQGGGGGGGGFPTAGDEKRNFAAFPPEPRRKPRTISAWIRGLTAPRVGLPLPAVLGTWGGGGGGPIPSRPTSSAGLSSAPTLLTTSSDGSEYLERQQRQQEQQKRQQQQRGRGRGRGRARERERALEGLSDDEVDVPRPAALRGGRR